MSDKQTTKECFNCGNTELVCMETLQLKLCSNCFIGNGKPEDAEQGKPTQIPWYKDEGQPGYSI